MLILISYDLENDRTRTALAHTLKDFGPRVQKSVFEADVTPKELERLGAKLEKVKLGKDDSIRLYHLCAECAGKVKIWGTGKVTKDQDYYIA
ncbi:CRISPR-associated endonuclease Cas2 [bacterium]|nr:CRISPR-associated endonuclease Cas2 [bacterium]